MKSKIRKWIFPFVLIGFALIFTISCKKDDYNSNQTNGKTSAVFNTQLTYGEMTDQDGNTYKTIKIGTQTWMAENLRTTKYRNGEAITNVTDNTAWFNLSRGAYCNYNNTKNNDTIATFGRLYNWFAVTDSRNIAPLGWHVPTDAEWTTLTTSLGGESVAGNKLKENGTTHWNNSNIGTTNESGFTALPGGYRNIIDGSYHLIGNVCDWWSASEGDTEIAIHFYLNSQESDIFGSIHAKRFGFCVRCVRDF